MRPRGTRGAERVARLGADPGDGVAIVEAVLRKARVELVLPPTGIEIASSPSRARPGARGRTLAGVVTLYPAAFADPWTLAWTTLHELAHAAGLSETDAESFAHRQLVEEGP